MNIDFFYIGCLVIFGIISSFTDIRSKKIRNSTIVLALISKIILDTIAILANQYSSENILSSYKNMLFFFGITIVLYIFNLMNAGDVKYTTIITGLIPIRFHIQSMFGERVLTFIFFSMGIIFIGDIITQIRKKQFLKSIKKTLNLKKIILQIITIFPAYLILIFIAQKFGTNINTVLRIMITYIAMDFIRKLKPNYQKIVLVITTIIGILLNFNIISDITFWKDYIIFTTIYMTFRILMSNLVENSNYKIKNIIHLKPTDTPYENIKYEIELIHSKKIKLEKINYKIFTNPTYTFENHIYHFFRIKSFKKVREFPISTNHEFVFDNKKIIDSNTRFKLEKLEIHKLKIHKKIAICPFINLGIILFIIKNLFF
ncbi:prepilin peptidase [Candidatus Woesearchaeota archaeon]|nr:prepilin peptidase [Candidatus Woesearchaeota archaeon]